jgi:hypothetical protein
MRLAASADAVLCVLASRLRMASALALLCLLAACAGGGGHYARRGFSPPSSYYPPPGPRSDPWGPYIKEAARRFSVPERWIREVMRQESGGRATATSSAGAMGLMQLMPQTYADLRDQYGLGNDPYEPHDNIMAGTAYIRQMYDRYGSPGFLAAYNAGPGRVDSYLSGGGSLPRETVNYVASIAPRLGDSGAMSGPLAVYAGSGSYGGGAAPVRVASAGSYAGSGCDPNAAYDPGAGCEPAAFRTASVQPVSASTGATGRVIGGVCDPNAAYDPSMPCGPVSATPAPPQVAPAVADAEQAAPAQTIAASTFAGNGACDPDAAYNPARPCQPAPAPVAASAPAMVAAAQPMPAPVPVRPTDMPNAYVPAPAPPQPASSRPHFLLARAEAATLPAAPARSALSGGWSIQVGAFGSPAQAREVADRARSSAREVLADARTEINPTTPFGNTVLYRARLSGLSQGAASDACGRLSQLQMACMVVRPQGW